MSMTNLIGQTFLERYRVEEFIGRGGMAEVYKVWDSTRSVHLAMKLLREDIAEDKVFLRRFKREARTLSNLQHPNIVRFYGLEQDNDLAFMLMDYVEGTTLRKEIFRAKRPFPPERVLEIMRPVCSALHYAHQMGMVHCDAKPGNIMIESSGRVLVTDFGIARMTDAATATMVGIGTPAYMAPEQVQGENPSPRTDIYALGVLLFEMLTGGERPFTGELADTTGSTGEKVRWEKIHLEPPSPRKWNAEISAELESIVLRCLAKDPAERYSNTIELLNALIPSHVDEQAKKAPPLIDIDDSDLSDKHPPKKIIIPPLVWVSTGLLVIVVALILSAGGKGGGSGQLSTPEVERVVVVVTATKMPEEEPSATPTSRNNPTATRRTPTATKIPTRTKVPSQTPDPYEARVSKVIKDVRAYWDYVDSQRFDRAWKYLTSNYKARKFNGDMDLYIEGWEGVDAADIKELEVTEAGTIESTVNILIEFTAGDNTYTNHLKLSLIWSQSEDVWQIDLASHIK
jgi:serine/threonine protein kinase